MWPYYLLLLCLAVSNTEEIRDDLSDLVPDLGTKGLSVEVPSSPKVTVSTPDLGLSATLSDKQLWLNALQKHIKNKGANLHDELDEIENSHNNLKTVPVEIYTNVTSDRVAEEHENVSPVIVTVKHESSPVSVVEKHDVTPVKVTKKQSKVDDVNDLRSKTKEKGGSNLGLTSDLKLHLPYLSIGGDISFNGDDYLNEIANLRQNLKTKLHPLTGIEGLLSMGQNKLNNVEDLFNFHTLNLGANKGPINILCKVHPTLCRYVNDLEFLLKPKEPALNLDLHSGLAALLESLKGKGVSRDNDERQKLVPVAVNVPISKPVPVAQPVANPVSQPYTASQGAQDTKKGLDNILCKLQPTLCKDVNNLQILLKAQEPAHSLDLHSGLAALFEYLKEKEENRDNDYKQEFVPDAANVPVSKPVLKGQPVTVSQGAQDAHQGLTNIFCKLHPTLCGYVNDMQFLLKRKEPSLSLDLHSRLESLLESLKGKGVSRDNDDKQEIVPVAVNVPVSKPVLVAQPVPVSQPVIVSQGVQDSQKILTNILCKLHPTLCKYVNNLQFLVKPNEPALSLDLYSGLQTLLESLKEKGASRDNYYKQELVPVAINVPVSQPVTVNQGAQDAQKGLTNILCKVHPTLCGDVNDLQFSLKSKEPALSLDLDSELAALLELLKRKGVSGDNDDKHKLVQVAVKVPASKPVPVSQLFPVSQDALVNQYSVGIPVSVHHPVLHSVSIRQPVQVAQPVAINQPVAVTQDAQVRRYNVGVPELNSVPASHAVELSPYSVGVPVSQYDVGVPVSVHIPELHSVPTKQDVSVKSVAQGSQDVPVSLGGSRHGSHDGVRLEEEYSRRSGGAIGQSMYGIGTGTQRPSLPMADFSYGRHA